MRITVGQLRRIIREVIEEQRLDEVIEEPLRDKLERWWLGMKGAVTNLDPEDQEKYDMLIWLRKMDMKSKVSRASATRPTARRTLYQNSDNPFL